MSSKKHEHTKELSAHKVDRRGFLKGAAILIIPISSDLII